MLAQQLRTMVALLQDTGLVLSTHVVAYNHMQFQFQEIHYLLLTSVGTRHVCWTHKYSCTNIHAYEIEVNKSLKQNRNQFQTVLGAGKFKLKRVNRYSCFMDSTLLLCPIIVDGVRGSFSALTFSFGRSKPWHILGKSSATSLYPQSLIFLQGH